MSTSPSSHRRGRKSDPSNSPPPQRRRALVEQLAGRRVLVVGDVILDRYLWGEVDRTSPEAPVPVVRLGEETYKLGGAANVVANLVALGGRPELVGLAGRDTEGETLQGLLAELSVAPGGLVTDRRRPTTVKTRVLAQGQQLVRMDREDDTPLAASLKDRLLKCYERALGRADVVILSDYGKGVLDEDLCPRLIECARAAGKPVVVDPKGLRYDKYRGADLIKPNRMEAQAVTGLSLETPDQLAEAARVIRRAARGRAIVMTLGAGGAAVFEPRRPPVHIPGQARGVYDVTGAGDSFIAAVGLALAAGATVVEAAWLGNVTGSIVVGKLGAATTEPAELLQAIQASPGNLKLYSATRLHQELRTHRTAGRQIVFTNGCFDLIHLGHLKFLEQARRLGDLLVVAINSDRSVRRLRGAPRPVLGQRERASILGSLEAVDYVVVFDEPTPESLLERLRPDVLVKGKNLKHGEIVGREIVESYGGRVESLPILGEMTTDALLERIARQS